MQPIKRFSRVPNCKRRKKSLIITWTQFARDDLVLSWGNYFLVLWATWAAAVNMQNEKWKKKFDFVHKNWEPNVKWKSHKSNKRIVEESRTRLKSSEFDAKIEEKERKRITFFCETLLDFYPLLLLFFSLTSPRLSPAFLRSRRQSTMTTTSIDEREEEWQSYRIFNLFISIRSTLFFRLWKIPSIDIVSRAS